MLFVGGWIMDKMTPQSNRVISRDGVSELEFFASRTAAGERLDWEDHRNQMLENNDAELLNMLTSGLTVNTELANERDEDITLPKWRENVKNTINKDYKEKVIDVLEKLERNYQAQLDGVEARYSEMPAPETREEVVAQKLQKKEEQAELEDAYAGLYGAILESEAETADIGEWLDRLAVNDEEERLVSLAIQLARVKEKAEAAFGRGVFETIVDFKFEQMEGAVRAVVLKRDFREVKSRIYGILLMVCWLSRFHPIYMIFLAILCLIIWSLFGGAICRIAALQAARDERIGAWRALQFSSNKFASFFSAPLIPLGVIALIGVLILVGGAMGAIPYVGEIVAGIFTGLALFGGFVIALMVLGLTGGIYLMYPTIAVEGSDSFDAISRSFSYVFARPWRMLFYMVTGVVYGAICFLFVRFFVFLLLIASYFPAGLIMNLDHASVSFRGKFEAIWTMPTFSNLRMGFGDIQWMSLNTTETIGALLIWVWVTLAAAAVIGFVVSYFFSLNTIIYYLLRKHVDATDLEDVYLEQDIEDLYQGSTENVVEPVESVDSPEVLANRDEDKGEYSPVKDVKAKISKKKAKTAKKKASSVVKKAVTKKPSTKKK